MNSDFMKTGLRFPNAHPLKDIFRKRKIPLWCLRIYSGVSEPKLSRYLNNIDNMPLDLQIKLYQLVEILNGHFRPADDPMSRTWVNDSFKPDETFEKTNKKELP